MINLINFIWDFGTLSLIIPTIICLYGFILFAWWWRRIGSATEVYAYMTFLYLTATIPLGVGVWQRWLYHNQPEFHDYYIHSNWYGIRTIPLIIALILITGRMTQRVIRTRQYEKGKKKDRREAPYTVCNDSSNQPNNN
jgi:hypothetical protein